LGIPYQPKEDPLDMNVYSELVIKPFIELLKSEDIGEPSFKIEPGRYLSAESSVILTQINTIKNNGYKLFVGVDAGFNTLLRPILYNSYHHIIPCNKMGKEKTLIYDVTGPICESGDILGRNRKLQELNEKEFLDELLYTCQLIYFFSSSYIYLLSSLRA